MQAEITIYIAAQTMPLIRVMLQGKSSSTTAEPRAASGQANSSIKGKSPATGADNTQQARASVELVQLSGGRIVIATSEEGKAFKASEAERVAGQSRAPQQRVHSARTNERASEVTVDDEVHRVWAEMGLSMRAWSQSPSPQPERG